MKDRKEQLKQEEFSISEGLELDQYTYEDYRIYTDKEDGMVYASVTTVLDEIKPDKFLEYWKKQNGDAAVDMVLKRASEEGTKVHNAIEELCLKVMDGEEPTIYMLDDWGNPAYNENEWKGVMRFVDFFNNHVDEVLMTEKRLKSKNLRIAGTTDNLFKLYDGRKVLCDTKFTVSLNQKFGAQTWAYREMYEEMYGERIEHRANLWLKAKTRGADKTGKKVQGKGWQLVFHENDEADEALFMAAHTIFFLRYKKDELVPLDRKYPTTLTLTHK